MIEQTHVSAAAGPPVLEVRGLGVRYGGNPQPVIADIDLTISAGQRVGIVGESGSGKSTLALAITGLLPRAAEIAAGTVRIQGRNIANVSAAEMRQMRGSVFGRVPQDSLGGLNPVITIGRQLRDALRAHNPRDVDAETATIRQAMSAVGVPDIDQKLKSYPHELSGGMRQRVLITMAMLNRPRLLIADEPTTALDATVQAQVLDALESATASVGMSLALVSHDMKVVASICDQVIVMYRGRIVEQGECRRVLTQPQHPYAKALVEASDQKRSRGRERQSLD